MHMYLAEIFLTQLAIK